MISYSEQPCRAILYYILYSLWLYLCPYIVKVYIFWPPSDWHIPCPLACLRNTSREVDLKSHNSIATRLSIVLAINGIYTKPVIFGHRPAHRLSIIGPIVAISRLSFASIYSTICTKSDVIAYKNSYKQPLYFGIPGVAVFAHSSPSLGHDRSLSLATIIDC